MAVTENCMHLPLAIASDFVFLQKSVSTIVLLHYNWLLASHIPSRISLALALATNRIPVVPEPARPEFLSLTATRVRRRERLVSNVLSFGVGILQLLD